LAQVTSIQPRNIGRYEVIARLGSGGMAELFLARTVCDGLEKRLVVKRIRRERANDPEFVQMFVDEARVAAGLDHPNVVQIYDVGRADGEYFIAMEYLRGRNLIEVMRAARRSGAGLQLQPMLSIATGVCAGLNYAHEKRDFDGRPLGIVHRDVSLQNVMVTFEGTPKLIDFGIARVASPRVETAVGNIKGKFGYMSPEQCRGLPVDRRSDLFSLGVVLFELVSGRRLYRERSEFETLKKIIEGKVPSLIEAAPWVPPALDQIVTRCLQKTPEERYASARELQEELEAFARDERMILGMVPVARELERLFPDELLQDPGGPPIAEAVASSPELNPSYLGEVHPSAPWASARRRRLVGRVVSGALFGLALAGGAVWWGPRLERALRVAHERATPPIAAVSPTQAAARPRAPEPVAEVAWDAQELTAPGDAQPVLVEAPRVLSPDPGLPLAPTVVCRLLVDTRGTVVERRVLGARAELSRFEDAALQAVAQARFAPARHDGRPVSSFLNLPVTFVVEDPR
jgi:serine/threonine-protein kinase